MFRYSLKRALGALAVLLVVSFITFIVLMWIPGNPALLMLGTDATAEKVEALSASMGLDEKWYVQYFTWFGNILRGDWGQSYYYGENVWTLIAQRIPVTFSLTIFSMTIAIMISALLGTYAALHKGGVVDAISRTLVQAASALPSFWLGMIFMIVFASRLGWFPITGFVKISEGGFWKFLNSITLPGIILALQECGLLIRMFRSSMIQALDEDFMQSASVKGLSRRRTIFLYAMRKSIIAPITLIGAQAAKLFGGTIVIETILALPGLGRLLLTSVEQRDLALLQGIVLFITFMVILMNYIADMIVFMVNPMIRINEEEGR